MLKWFFYLLIFLAIRAFIKSRVRLVYRGPSMKRGTGSGDKPRPPQKFQSMGTIETSAREL